MIKQTIRDGFLYAIPAIFGRGMGILLIPLYTRYLSPNEYGVIDLLLVIYAFLNLMLPLEVGQGMVRFFADTEEKTERELCFSTAFWFTSAMFAVFCCFVFLNFDYIAGSMFAGIESQLAIKILFISMFANALVYLVSDQLRFDMRPFAYSSVSIVVAGVTVGMVLLLVVDQQRGVLGYAWAMITAQVSGLLAGLLFAHKGLSLRWRFSVPLLKQMLVFSAPLVLSAVAVYGNNYIDRWAILYFLGYEQLGVYASAFRISTGVFLVLLPIQMAITPLIYKNHAEPGTAWQMSALLDATLFALASGILIIGALIPEVYALLVGEAYREGAWLVPWLAITVALMNLYIFTPGMTLARRTGVIAGINALAVIINTALNFILIPVLGLWGAVIATLCAGLVLLVAYFYVSHRYYPLPYKYVHCVLSIVVVSVALQACMLVADVLWLRVGFALIGIISMLMLYKPSLHRLINEFRTN